MKSTKRSLFTSALALFLCFSMLLGTTFAWFTDTVTSGNNKIVSGSLKVDLELFDKETGTWESIKDSKKAIFDHKNWEPGYTDVKVLRITNKGSLALKWDATIIPLDELTALANVIDVYVYSGKTAPNARPGRNDLEVEGYHKVGTLREFAEGLDTESASALLAGESDYLGIALKMRESAGNEYKNTSCGEFDIRIVATQYSAESEKDSFDENYDNEAQFPVFKPADVNLSVQTANGFVTADAYKKTGSASMKALAGTKVTDDRLSLNVSEMAASGSNVKLEENEAILPLDVHVDGVAPDNTKPIIITLDEAMMTGLNIGNYKLYHVEDGVANLMTAVSSLDELDAHNEFYYDPATGNVSLAMATFSEVAMVADTENAWEGNFDYSWYDASKTELAIANADQLAAFGAIVGGMDGQTQDSFKDKTVKLTSDINLGDKESENNPNIIFYPIGYYNSEGTYERTNTAITSGLRNFEGTFDGNGHTVSNFYHNTWEMKGDHNWYSPEEQYYRDGMGLFGRVYGGTVKNLTVKNFSSDGEIATTGVIAAYADGAKFENIAIFDCNPRVYNIGNGGIVGCVGWYAKEAGLKTTFTNITVDNSNKISALWGSYDVACGGIVGQYYPTSGQSSYEYPENAGIHFENCHISAQMDVYNDVCANYQYYAYRYTGMLIGSVRENETIGGHVYPKMDGITADGCTVHFGTWNDYYYCEIIDNTTASYTHDYQMSRLTEIKEINGTTITYLDGTIGTIPASGRANYVIVDYTKGHGTDNATCYHFKDGAVWNHEDAGYHNGENGEKYIDENGDGKADLKEDKQHIYLEFNNLVTGYGWGVTTKGVGDLAGVTILDKYNNGESSEKFKTKFTGNFLYRVGNLNTVSLGSLFTEIDGKKLPIVDSGVWVTVEAISGNAAGTYTANTTDWTQGNIKFTGTGVVKVTIQDYIFCEPTVLYLEVVDAENTTSAVGATNKNIVLLDNVTFSSSYLYYKNATIYGNGFTIDITGADHSDLKDSSDTSSNKSAYCNIWMVNSTLNNVKVKGSVYPEVGMTADSNYGNAAIRTEGECYIRESYISNCRVPLRIQGNTTLTNTVVDGGRYANIELRFGKLTLDGVTTINNVQKGSDNKTDVIGFGIVIHDEATTASISVIGDGLKQYNWVGEKEHKSILSGDSYLSNAYKLIFNSNNSDSIYFEHNDDRYVNTGILCLSANISKDSVTGLDDHYCQEVSGYDAWVLTYDNSKHSAWFNESVGKDPVTHNLKQYPTSPDYFGNDSQTVEFTRGETYLFDTSVLKAEKFGNSLDIGTVIINGTEYNYGDKIAITEGGTYDIIYTVIDPYNYNKDASTTTTVNHTISITVTAITKDAEILAPKFTFIDQNGNKYESTTVKVGDKTYVMPNVTAADPTTNSMSSINIGNATISGTTVYFPVTTGYTVRSGSNFNRYYPLFNGINITDYTIAGDTTGTAYTTSGNYTSLVGSSGTKFIIPANGGQTNCGDYVKTNEQSGNAAGNSDSGWQGAGYSTSYGGTYLKSGNTNASSGADSNGYERIVWVEYCFNAGNGDVYYYRIGYHCNKESAQSCVTPDTLVTLADGTQVRVDALTGNEMLLVWNHQTGTMESVPVAYIVNHDGVASECEVISLNFSNGRTVKIIGEHVFFDATLNKYVAITSENANEFIGHKFAAVGADGNALEMVELSSIDRTIEITTVYEVVSYKHLTCFTEGILSTSAYLDPLLNVFDINEDTLAYDAELVQSDIEKYGLYTYADFEGLISEEAFELYNAAYLKIAVGKGYITWDDILELIDIYFAADVQPV